jgi:hypothetical protein
VGVDVAPQCGKGGGIGEDGLDQLHGSARGGADRASLRPLRGRAR